MGQIFLIRHGQASLGAADYDRLSPLGREQARLLGQWFAGTALRIDRVLVGGMRRHRETAEACLAEVPGAPAAYEADHGFDEFDHHQSLVRHWPPFAEEGAIARMLAEADGQRHFQRIVAGAMVRWSEGRHDADYTESWSQFHARCGATLARLVASAGKSQNIAVFTSGGPVASICGSLLGIGSEQLLALTSSIVNCSVTKLMLGARGAGIAYINSQAHLEWLGGPDKISFR